MGETPHDLNVDSGQDAMIAVYRHDVHKMNGNSHASASKTFAGIPVNEIVPLGADGDASLLSRPSGQPEQTVENHKTPYRLSLITGESQYNHNQSTSNSAVCDLLNVGDPEIMHQAWLEDNIVSMFNESVYYPYTSLKYHTLLVSSLLDNYRVGHDFADLRLIVDPAGDITPHRTVYAGSQCTLRIDKDSGDRPASRLGSQPWRSWASAWGRLGAHPVDAAHDKYDMLLDANLHRIGAWSTALQYLEDFREAFE